MPIVQCTICGTDVERFNKIPHACCFQCKRTRKIAIHADVKKARLYLKKKKEKEYAIFEQNVIKLLRGCGII